MGHPEGAALPFIVAAFGADVPDFMLHVYASMAQEERRMIANRTRAALAQPKARGVRLGNRKNLAEASAKGQAAQRAAANAYAANILPVVREIQAAGHITLRAIAAELARRNVRTARGGTWSAETMRSVLPRA